MTNLKDAGAGSLRQALVDTPATGTVDFQDGLKGTITLTSGPLTINKLLTIAGPGASVITVNGNNAQQVLNIPAPFTVDILGLTIASGRAGAGGGISNGGALTLTGCILKGNTADTGRGAPGGGIYNTGRLTVMNCTLSGNTAVGNSLGSGSGGGIYNTGTLTVTSSTLSGNSGGGYGGGIYNTGTLIVTSSTLSDNGSGGIYNTGTLTVTSSTLSGNSGGGGISNTGTLTVTSSTLSANSASGSGGGISNSGGGNVSIDNSTFTRNAAVDGAGISHTGNGTLTVTSSTINNNFASGQGGGIAHTGNGRAVIRNTILAGNSPPGSSPDVMGALNSQGHNLIGNDTGGSGYSTSDIRGTSASPIDPLLGPLEDNNGPTIGAPGNTINLQTEKLLPGSRATDAGDNANAPPYDERGPGFPRIVNGTIDIGAFEVQSAAVAQLVLSAPSSVTLGVPFDVTVKAVDNNGNTVTGYTGTVHFTSDPQGARLPDDYPFTASDNGVHTFPNGVTLSTPGSWTITVTDSSGITGNATIIATSSAPTADHFVLNAPGSATAGAPFDVTVKAVDSNGDGVPGYAGTVHFTSTDPYPGVVLPSDYTFTSDDQGTHTFTGGVTLFTAGSQMLTVQDTTTSSIAGSATINVSASAADHLVLTPPASAVAGTPFDVTLTAFDAYGNVAVGYTGTLIVTSLDRNPQPSDYTLTPSDNGTHIFHVTLFTAGTQTLLARDMATGAIAGTASVTVVAAPADHFLVSAPSMVTSGMPFNLIVTALDPYGNTDTNYQGSVVVTSSDAAPEVVLPTGYTFTSGSGGDNGLHGFLSGVTFITSGDQILTVTDTANGTITGSTTIAVSSPAAPPGGGANRPRTPSLTAGSTPALDRQSAQQIALLDRIFSSLNIGESTPVWACFGHERLADDPFGGDEGLLG